MKQALKNSLYEYGFKFRAIRKAIGLTQYEAAQIIGIDAGSLSKIECGKINLSLASMVNILDAYGFKMCFVLDVDDLLAYNEFVVFNFKIDPDVQ